MEEAKPFYKSGWKVAGLALAAITLAGLGLFVWRTYYFYTQIKQGKSFEELMLHSRKSAQPDETLAKYRASLRALVSGKPGEPFAGPASSTNEIAVFMDYDCEYSKQAVPVIHDLIRTRPDVKVIMKDYPVAELHPQAFLAAKAARCVWDQGKQGIFWAYYDRLFADQGKHDAQGLRADASELGADAGGYDKCMQEPKIEQRIRTSELEGGKAGIRGTPAFFVNGIKLEGPVELKQLTDLLN